MDRTLRRAALTVALTFGAVVIAPLVLLGALYVGTAGALAVADALYTLSR